MFMKHTYTKRTFAFLTALTLCTGALAGCGDTDSSLDVSLLTQPVSCAVIRAKTIANTNGFLFMGSLLKAVMCPCNYNTKAGVLQL